MSGYSKRCVHAADRDAGLTLIELLLALGLLSLITLVLVGALRSGRIALDHTQQISEEASVATVRSFLRNLLSQAKPMQMPGLPQEPVSVLTGTSTTLKLVSGHASPGQYAGLYVNGIHARPAQGNARLLDVWIAQELYRPSLPEGSQAGAKPESVRLLRAVAGIEFSYSGSQSENAPPTWSRQWRDPRRLPALVSVTVRFPANDQRRWPPLIVALPLARK